MKKLLLTAVLIAALLVPGISWTAELNNVTARGEDGNLVFYDASMNVIMTLDAANRKLSFPSGSVLETLGSTITLRGVTYTLPAADGAASQFLQTNGSAALSWATGGATAYDDIADPDADSSITFGDNEILEMTFADTNEDMFTIQGLGAFGDVSIVRIEQKTGLATDGTVLEVVSADTDVDALVVTANGADVINVGGAGTITINGTEFDVSGTDGSITINDDGNAGQVSVEGSILDINSLTFVGAGEIASAASTAITINPNAGNAAGEDLIVTAHNVQLTAAGAMTLSPDGAVVTALDITDTDYTNAMSVGTNNILGSTGAITYDNWSINADGDFTGVDATFTGSVNVGTWKQDAVVAATAATTITIDGTGVGGVTLGGTSTGTITLGGGATLVNLPSTVDLVLAGGDLTATDTANADMVTFTNNTMTTADLLVLSAAGTRTSDNVIEITDGATSGTTIGITANAMTSGDGVSYTNSGAVLTGSAFAAYITDGAGFTGYYFRGYDGAADDFSVKQYGATTIAGNASTNVLTVTAGDVQIDDGLIEIDTDEDDMSYIKRNQGATSKPVFKVWEAAAAADSPALQIVQDATAAASYGMEIDSAGGTSIHLAANGAAGDQVLVDVTDAWTGQAYKVDAGPWVGTLGEGAALDFRSDSAATSEAGSAIYVKMQGTGVDAAAIDGKGLYIEDEAALTAGSYLVKLDTLANTALHISNAGAAADGIKFDLANAYTGQGILVDAGPWLGTAGEGFFAFTSDNAVTAEAGQVIKINLQGTAADAAAISGKGLYIKDTAGATAGSYLAHIESTNNGAAYLSGDIDVNLPANDDFIYITANAADYAAGAGAVTVYNTAAAGNTNAAYLLRLVHEANGDAQDNFILLEDNSTGAAGNGDDMFKIDSGGAMTVAGVSTFQNQIVNTPMTFAFTTEANITDPLTSTVVLLDGDDDADNDAVDLQNGTTAGQIVIFIAAVEIDASDTCTINMADTTCTNCPAIVFDAVGESATLVWTGATWAVTSLRQ